METSADPPDTAAEIERTQWLITNYDQRRASLATRCSIIVVANSIVLSACADLLVKRPPSETGLLAELLAHPLPALSNLGSSLFLGLALGASVASIIAALHGILNIVPQRKKFGSTERGVFHPRNALEKWSDVNQFTNARISSDDYLAMAKHQLWTVLCEYGDRYGKLRRAARLLAGSMLALLCDLVLQLARIELACLVVVAIAGVGLHLVQTWYLEA